MTLPLSVDELALLAQSTFADTAFLLTELADDPAALAESRVCVEIAFDGELKGRLVLAATELLAAELAADMLCVERGHADAALHARGALAELANVFAGVLLPRVFGERGAWKLGLPRLRAAEPGIFAGERSRAVTLVSDSGQPIRVELVLEGDTQSPD
ncbi:MAG TPA: chemotaxis protein CheX [Polyangiaceae bacterium]|nr:chemotaxis protein CheX [Polyangiaceae bacterium]